MSIPSDPRIDAGLDPLILDLVEWVAREPRTYSEVMDAWRTTCPRLTVWEDAVDRGLLTRHRDGRVLVTSAGSAFLAAHRPSGRSVERAA